jgi:hypothetical protein
MGREDALILPVFVITPGARHLHFIGSTPCGDDAEAGLYEDPTVTAGTGAAVTPRNHNRGSARASTATVRANMTVTGDGTQLEQSFLPGGTGPNAIGSTAGQRQEWILAPGHVYLVRLINRSGNNQPASMTLQWYEEE